MHSIERYGIVALLFLVVTIVAVLLWDGGEKAPGTETARRPEALAAKTAPAAKTAAGQPQPGPAATGVPALDSGSDDRLVLTAEPRPGPLTRGLEQRRAEAAPVLPAPRLEPDAAGASPTARTEEATLRQQPEGRAQPRAAFAQPVAASAQPVAASARTYTVRPGDTLSEIAQRQLGSSRRWKEIVAVNPGLDPDKVRVGQALVLPDADPGAAGASSVAAAPGESAERPAAAPAAAPAKGPTYKVAAGDSLWRIAQRALGDGNRWREIAALNPKVDPDRLAAGLVLVLPAQSKVGAPAPQKNAAPRSQRPPVVASRAAESSTSSRSRAGKVQ